MKETIYTIVIFALTIYAILASIKVINLNNQKEKLVNALMKVNDEKFDLLEQQQDTTYIVPFHQF